MDIAYVLIGIIVGIVCSTVVYKEASEEFDYGFGDFLLTCFFALSAFSLGAVLWPVAILIGGLWLVYKYREDEWDDIRDFFKIKSREDGR